MRHFSKTITAAVVLTVAFAGAPHSARAQTSGSSVTPVPASNWLVNSQPHVDLWIHGFAMLATDTAAVPLYRRGYRDSLAAIRTRANLLTALDANREALSRGLANNPSYIQAQFFAFEFGSWEEMRLAIERFLQYNGDARKAPDRNTATRIAMFASVFRSAADRDWLRLFLSGLIDEHARFYQQERTRVASERQLVFAAVDSLWRQQYASKFERFLNNSTQRRGDMLLSLPIGGEGRTSTVNGRSVVAVTFPARVEDARDAILVFAHEITGSLVSLVVEDHTTPAEKRNGEGDRMIAFGQVRAGALLLQRIAPELQAPYIAFYLAQAGKSGAPTMDALAAAFPLSQAVTDGLLRQIDIVLGGI